jgi:predicted Rossmann-fold nucleotide-binding protein
MGSARNMINVLSSHVVVACPGGAGTLSEIALALKHGRPVILLDMDVGDVFSAYQASGRLQTAATPEEAVAAIKSILQSDLF